MALPRPIALLLRTPPAQPFPYQADLAIEYPLNGDIVRARCTVHDAADGDSRPPAPPRHVRTCAEGCPPFASQSFRRLSQLSPFAMRNYVNYITEVIVRSSFRAKRPHWDCVLWNRKEGGQRQKPQFQTPCTVTNGASGR
jgi:hypothetical protein